MSDEIVLSDENKRTLLRLARGRIENRIRDAGVDLPPVSASLSAAAGAFVTLRNRDTGQLRGCIGHIEAVDSVYDTVSEVAVQSALKDPRFPSLRSEELDGVEIEISVLSPLRKIDSVEELEAGRHGILMRRGASSGLLLPQVASERGWDSDTFVRQTCRKAGLPPGCQEDPETQIFVFTAVVFDESLLAV